MYLKSKLLVSLILIVLFCSSCTRILLNAHVNSYSKKNGLELPELVLKDLNGNMVNTKSFKGKVILLNNWGTWCGPCLGELPGLNYIHKKLNDQPDFLLLNVCVKSSKEQWRKTIADRNLAGINLYVPDSLLKKYDVFNIDEGLPNPYILSKDSRVLGRNITIEAEGENLLGIYTILKAMDNVDVKTSAKELISLSRQMKKIYQPEMKAFKDFFGKYVDTTSIKASAKFIQ